MDCKKIIYFIYNSPLDLKNGSNTHVLELSSHISKNMNILLFAPLSTNNKKLPNFISYIKVSGSNVSSILYQLSYQIGLFFKLLLNCINCTFRTLALLYHYAILKGHFVDIRLIKCPIVKYYCPILAGVRNVHEIKCNTYLILLLWERRGSRIP